MKELAEKYNKTPAQIILRYTVCIDAKKMYDRNVYLSIVLCFSLQVQNGAIVIPKTTKKNHMKENLDIFDFSLSDSDMETMNGYNSNSRLVNFDGAEHHKYYPFGITF